MKNKNINDIGFFEIYFILFVLFLCWCGQSPPDSYHNNYRNITDYKINIVGSTKSGIRISCDKYCPDYDQIDNIVSSLEDCLNTKINRSIIVHVPDDIYISKCSKQMLFPCSIDDRICIEDKDLPISKECPCNCRGAIQDENIIVTVPTLITFKGELARMITGINNPWRDSKISKCLGR